jgi:hypothetical protein
MTIVLLNPHIVHNSTICLIIRLSSRLSARARRAQSTRVVRSTRTLCSRAAPPCSKISAAVCNATCKSRVCVRAEWSSKSAGIFPQSSQRAYHICKRSLAYTEEQQQSLLGRVPATCCPCFQLLSHILDLSMTNFLTDFVQSTHARVSARRPQRPLPAARPCKCPRPRSRSSRTTCSDLPFGLAVRWSRPRPISTACATPRPSTRSRAHESRATMPCSTPCKTSLENFCHPLSLPSRPIIPGEVEIPRDNRAAIVHCAFLCLLVFSLQSALCVFLLFLSPLLSRMVQVKSRINQKYFEDPSQSQTLRYRRRCSAACKITSVACINIDFIRRLSLKTPHRSPSHREPPLSARWAAHLTSCVSIPTSFRVHSLQHKTSVVFAPHL